MPVRPLSLAFRAALIAALATLFYARTIDFAFAYDDDLVVLRNPAVTGHAWGAIATAPYHQGPDVRTPSGLYRPLTLWSLAANHVLSADRPWSYHLANVLLHAAAAALVLVCGEAVGLSALAATAGAAVFAIHPVHVEAVANVSGRAELLATLGLLGSFLAFARCRNPAGRVTVPGQFATCGLGAAALAAKENAITFVAVAAAWEALRPVAPGSPGRRRVAPLNLAPSLVLAGSYLALRLAVLGGLGLAPGAVTPIENPVVGLAPLPRAWTVLATFGRAVSLLVTPVRLAPDYGFAEIVPVRSLLDPGAAVGLLFFLACLAGIAIAWRARPELAFVGVLGLATWSIVSNAFVTIGTILGDRLLYLPSVAVCLLAGAAIAAAVRRFRWRGAGVPVAAAGLLLAARAWTYTTVWSSDGPLFAHAVAATPDSIRALNNRAQFLAEHGELDPAEALLDRALALAPDVVPVLLNRGAIALARGDGATAGSFARRVLALDPGNPDAQAQLARIR